jgi:hypothetical protein
MGNRQTDSERRRLLALVGSGLVTGLAGCSGGGGDGGGGDGDGGDGDGGGNGGDGGDGGDGGGDDTVPAEYETATALGGTQRNPDGVSSKEAVNYQDQPQDGQQCSNCRYYIEDKNGDGMGACAIVAGNIAPEAYCVSYAVYDG